MTAYTQLQTMRKWAAQCPHSVHRDSIPLLATALGHRRVSLLGLYRLRQQRLLSTASLQVANAPGRNEQPKRRPIEKLLIANRGEIACRIASTARRLGVRCAAVYSDVDAGSKHVCEADEAYWIGRAAAADSYLRKDRIIEIAKRCGAQAIHPGYGFLSENVEFADMCQDEGIIFVGPPVNAIRDMGIKSTSKHIMSSAGVPIIEGYHGEEQSAQKLLEEARRIGFPVMLKAVRGGGGKGMRIAMSEAHFNEQLESAKREAMKSFGDEVMLVEKFVENPRHVEVQVFGDTHGNHVYLFERDCSVQRRHQKIIEEAPAPGVSPDVRREIGEAAVRAAKAVDYVGAGTVEFVMDSEYKFYFMEMNTRLQVEHPITEMITGVDLVEWQLLVASGEPLPMLQKDLLEPKGHAFEARVYAEDPKNNFMPAAGLLKKLRPPVNGRVDTGVREGDEVSVHYDPMIAKLIVWGSDRISALAKLRHALSNYVISGMPTNIPFLLKLASHPSFQDGDVHTEFIPQHRESLLGFQPPSDKMVALSALAMVIARVNQQPQKWSQPSSKGSLQHFRLNMDYREKIRLKYGEDEYLIKLTIYNSDSGDRFSNNEATPKDNTGKGVPFRTFGLECNSFQSELRASFEDDQGVAQVRCELPDEIVTFQSNFDADTGKLSVFTEDDVLLFDTVAPAYVAKLASAAGEGAGGGGAVAPMPGVIEQIMVTEGQRVEKDQPLIVMIAMKMEYVIRAAEAGIVSKVLFKKGDNVAKNTQLVQITTEQDDTNAP